MALAFIVLILRNDFLPAQLYGGVYNIPYIFNWLLCCEIEMYNAVIHFSKGNKKIMKKFMIEINIYLKFLALGKMFSCGISFFCERLFMPGRIDFSSEVDKVSNGRFSFCETVRLRKSDEKL